MPSLRCQAPLMKNIFWSYCSGTDAAWHFKTCYFSLAQLSLTFKRAKVLDFKFSDFIHAITFSRGSQDVVATNCVVFIPIIIHFRELKFAVIYLRVRLHENNAQK